METKKRGAGRVIALIMGVAAAVTIVAAAAMAATGTGVFRSDKTKAFELLAQMPDKLGRSDISEYLGLEKLLEKSSEKGISQNVRLSGLKCKEDLLDGIISSGDLSGYVIQYNILTDSSYQKLKMLVSMAKEEDKISAVVYRDEDKSSVAFPGLTGNKVLVADNTLLNEIRQNGTGEEETDTTKIQTTGRDLRAFVQEEFRYLYDEASVTKESKEKYRLTIPKDSLAVVMADVYQFMSKHEELTRLLDTCLKTDCLSAVKNAGDRIRENPTDLTFFITGKDDSLSQVSASVTMQGKPLSLTMDFEGREDARAVILLKTSWKGEELQFRLELKDRKTESYEESAVLQLLIGDVSFGKLSYRSTVDPKQNKYTMEAELKSVGKEVVKLQAKGSIKNLNPGKTVSYALDKVRVRVSGEEIFSTAMDLTIGVLEDSIEPPEGEEIVMDQMDDLQDPVCQQFALDLVKNGTPILMKWGLIDPGQLLGRIQKGAAENDDKL